MHHNDQQVDARIDRRQEAATEEAYPPGGHDLPRDIAEHRRRADLASGPFLQAVCPSVKGDAHRHGGTVQVETTWLDQPCTSRRHFSGGGLPRVIGNHNAT